MGSVIERKAEFFCFRKQKKKLIHNIIDFLEASPHASGFIVF